MKALFQRLITDSIEREWLAIQPREFDFPVSGKKIIALIGVRRCGKTYLLYTKIQELRKTIDSNRIVYINFEDDRLSGLALKDLDALIEGYFDLFPANREQKVYLFFDEVQAVPGWEMFIRRIYDTLNVAIFITGSSSKLLSSEIATNLRGRTVTYEVFPLSFAEYLQFKNVTVNLHSSKSLGFIRNNLNEYLLKGGFPEIIGEPENLQKRILSDYVNLIVYKDIIERHGIKNHPLLRQLIKYCFMNISTLFSFNKLYRDYKSQGFSLSKDTLFEYFHYLNDAYALFSVPIFRNSIREEQRNPSKIYAVDTGFKYIFDPFISKDISKLYENCVYLHLRRKTNEIYYLKQKQEADFYVIIEGQKTILNVCADIANPDTRNREINSLAEGMQYTGCKNAWLVTDNDENRIRTKQGWINVISLYKFLLDNG